MRQQIARIPSHTISIRMMSLILFMVASGVPSLPLSFAAPVSPSAAPFSTCGILEAFGGHVEVLDAARKHLRELSVKAAISCGGWISVSKGWVEIRHRDGHRILAGEWSFFQLTEAREDEQVVLYRGQLLVHARSGSGELRVITPNARGRFLRSKGILLFNQKEEETQLIALENSASLENRFQSSRKIVAKEGESTHLNLKTLRVLPSTPRAISFSSVRDKLELLRIEEQERWNFLKNVRKRAERKFAISLNNGNGNGNHKEAERKPAQSDNKTIETYASFEKEAAEQTHAQSKPSSATQAQVQTQTQDQKQDTSQDYNRHQAHSDDAKLQKHLVNRLVSGGQTGEKILFPDQVYGRTKSVKFQVEQPTEHKRRHLTKEEEEERKRLMEALSEIRPD